MFRIEKDRDYGMDIDGNRCEVITFYEVISDVSGKTLDENDLYYYEEEVMSFDELLSLDTISYVGGLIYSEMLDKTFEDRDDYEDAMSNEFMISIDSYIETQMGE